MCAFFKCWRWIEWNCAAVELKCNQDLACTYLDIAIVWVDFVRHLKLPWRLLLPPLHRTWKESWLNWRLQRTCFDWMQKSHLLRIHIFFIFFFMFVCAMIFCYYCSSKFLFCPFFCCCWFVFEWTKSYATMWVRLMFLLCMLLCIRVCCICVCLAQLHCK